MGFTDEMMAEFVGNLDRLSATASEGPTGLVNARHIDLDRLYSMYTRATTSAERVEIGQELQQELQSQLAVDVIHDRFLALVFPGDDAKQEEMRTSKVMPSLMDCEMRVHTAFRNYAAEHFDANSGFALQFHQIVVNVCAEFAQANGPISQLEGAVKDACSQGILV